MISFPDGIDDAVFLRDYWQQRPLLLPGALSGFQSPIDRNEVAGLALEEEVESRLVLERGNAAPWQLRQGPFQETDLTSLPSDSPWTLLVQAVDLWVPEVREVIDQFPFLPRWRMDDIMISIANNGGSVGPHFDYYDVFLIQAEGLREWSVGGLCDENTALLAGADLKILETFNATETWLLKPGDVLYLPPRIAHWGRAMDDDCMTWSLGFRAPTAGEMLDDLATEVLSRGPGHHYRDPALTPAMASDTIAPEFISQVRALLMETLDDESLLAEWFASYMTRPEYPGLSLDDPDCQRRAELTAVPARPPRTFVDGIEVLPDEEDQSNPSG